MTDAEFEALPFGSEGLWRKFMHACRSEATLDGIIAATKSKRYTRTRIDRMVMCAFLGITAQDLASPAPYVRALALNDRGRTVLKQARERLHIINAGETVDHPYFRLERRCADLYGLFSATIEAPGAEEKQRIYYHKENS
jgi:predicted nucleotidyltransferase